MSLANEAGILLAYAVGMLGLFVFLSMFIVPIKFILKLMLNSLFGGIVIAAVNILGDAFGIHIALNLVTAAAVGILGVPGAVMILLLQWML